MTHTALPYPFFFVFILSIRRFLLGTGQFFGKVITRAWIAISNLMVFDVTSEVWWCQVS